MTPTPDRYRAFRDLHQSGTFVIPNPWDVGSARLLAQLGFKALATTSAGFAWSQGRADNEVTLDEALAHIRTIADAVEVPVNADFEGGFAVEPEAVGANVALAAATGVAGISIEDSTGDAASPLFDFALAVERVRAARQAIEASGRAVLLTGRSEGFIAGRPDLAETIRRLIAYAEAGADCLYAPGIRTREEIAAVVKAVAPKPVNVLVGSDFTTVAALTDLGVRRISVGGALARAAWGGFLAAAREIAEHGTFLGLARAVPFAEIDGAFKARSGSMRMKSAPRGDDTSKVEVSGISPHGVWLLLGDREVFLPFKEFPWFREASVGAVLHVERPQPHHLYWPDLDVDLAVDSILEPERFPLISRERPRPASRRSAPSPPKRPKAASRRPRNR